MVLWVGGGGGGYVSWAHFLLRFTEVFIGVGGAIVLNIVGICRDSPIVFMRHAYLVVPMDVDLICISYSLCISCVLCISCTK